MTHTSNYLGIIQGWEKKTSVPCLFFLLPWACFFIYTLCAPRSFSPLAFRHSLLHPELHRVSYLPPPAFFIPSSVPLPLHHHCLHRQRRRQWRRSHYGHLSDSISVICKSSSGVTGTISPCVLQVKGWPVCVRVSTCVFTCPEQRLGSVTVWEDVCVCAVSRGWYHSQFISSWFWLEPGLRTGK